MRLGLDVRDFEHLNMAEMMCRARYVEDLTVRQIDGVVDEKGRIVLFQPEQCRVFRVQKVGVNDTVGKTDGELLVVAEVVVDRLLCDVPVEIDDEVFSEIRILDRERMVIDEPETFDVVHRRPDVALHPFGDFLIRCRQFEIKDLRFDFPSTEVARETLQLLEVHVIAHIMVTDEDAAPLDLIDVPFIDENLNRFSNRVAADAILVGVLVLGEELVRMLIDVIHNVRLNLFGDLFILWSHQGLHLSHENL